MTKPSPRARVLAVLPAEAWATTTYIARQAGLSVLTTGVLLERERARGGARRYRETWRRVEQTNSEPTANAVGKE